MRLSTILTAAVVATQASARWLALTADPVTDLRGGDLARPTMSSELHDYEVWAPQPTPPPSKAIVDFLLHRRVTSDLSSAPSTNNTWENEQTCGWYAGISSKPYVCDSPLSCATTNDVVACATDGLEQFYTVCLNYAAVKSGKCSSVGVQTGCCQDATAPQCGTFLWGGTSTRSMFKCFASETLIHMNDEPQYVIDSSISAASASSLSASSAAASRSSAEAASRSHSPSSNGLSIVIATTTAPNGSPSTLTSVVGHDSSVTAGARIGDGHGDGGGKSSTNTGAVAGGVIGGLLLLILLILLLIWCIMRKKNKKFSLSLCGGKKKTSKEKHVHNKSYKEMNVTNNDKRAYDQTAYDKRSYSYEKRSYDSKSYNEDTHSYDPRSTSITPNQNFHFHVEDDRYDTTPEPRQARHPTPPPIQPPASVILAGAAPATSRREQRRLARQQKSQPQPQQEPEPERDLLLKETEQAREQQSFRTHRYHPSSGQRYHEARKTPTPPAVSPPSAPDLDFIGRGI